MPELPEVETVRRGLAPAMVGARIERSNEARRHPLSVPAQLSRAARRAADRSADAAGEISARPARQRRDADRPSRHVRLVPHRGRFRRAHFHHPRSKDPKHDHVVIHLDNGKAVTYNDPRRFGFMDLARDGTSTRHPRLAGLGDEPLAPEFDGGAAGCAVRRVARAPEIGAARPEADRGPGQYLRLRGAFPREAVAVPPGRRSRRRDGRPDQGRERARQGDPRRARGGDRGGRFDAARPSPGGRRRSAISSTPSRSTTARACLPEAGLQRDDRARRAHPGARRSIVRSARSSCARPAGRRPPRH